VRPGDGFILLVIGACLGTLVVAVLWLVVSGQV
jgi:hypothetical protein